jgi:hypothetical protein
LWPRGEVMKSNIDKALDAVGTLAPQEHGSLSAEMKALQNEKREAIECLRRITEATKIRGPLGTSAYIINDETMQNAIEIISRS